MKPANKEYEDFLDNKLISRVKFKIHDSFAQPLRTVSKPPFRISETGFASFATLVTIYLNIPNDKPRVINYELTLFVGDHDLHTDLQKLVLKNDAPPWFLELAKKYSRSKKRKASMISSSNDEKSPQENQKDYEKPEKEYQKEYQKPEKEREYPKSEKERDYQKPEKEKDSKEHHRSKKLTPIKEERSSEHRSERKHTDSSPRKKEKKEKKEEKPEKVKTPEELTRRLNECSDPYVIYKASEFLLSLPDTKLSSSSLKLTFDLSKCNVETLLEVGRILKAKKSKK